MVVATVWMQACRNSNAPVTGVPAIGSRVRIQSPELGTGWRVGMFNQTRLEPPCYIVLLWDPGPTRRLSATVPVELVTRMQLSSEAGMTAAVDNEAAASIDGERWREVQMDSMRVRPDCSRTISTRS
jgi:hypothetical protein